MASLCYYIFAIFILIEHELGQNISDYVIYQYVENVGGFGKIQSERSDISDLRKLLSCIKQLISVSHMNVSGQC